MEFKNVTIKEEPFLENELSTELQQNINGADNKLDIKEEPWHLDAEPTVKCELEGVHISDLEHSVSSSSPKSSNKIDKEELHTETGPQNEDSALCMEGSDEFLSSAELRLQPKSVGRDSESTSCFVTGTNFGANNFGYCNLKEANSAQMPENLKAECNSWDSDNYVIENGSASHLCQSCGRSFSPSPVLVDENLRASKYDTCENSVPQHTLNDEGKVQHICKHCNIKASVLNERTLTQEAKQSYVCEICKKSFARASRLKQHMITHEDSSPHVCEMCNKHFTRASSLKQHKLIHEGKKPFLCEICNKNFTQTSTLNQHKLIHKGIKPFSCEICNKNFTQISTLKQHKVIHEGKRSRTCGICNKSFTQESALRRHILTVHENKRPYSCEICKKKFTLPSRLKQHELIHQNRKPHKCGKCNKSFTLESALKRHVLIVHEDKRPYSCEICKKNFSLPSRLKQHKLIHQSRRPDKCGNCNKTFKRAKKLQQHKLMHL